MQRHTEVIENEEAETVTDKNIVMQLIEQFLQCSVKKFQIGNYKLTMLCRKFRLLEVISTLSLSDDAFYAKVSHLNKWISVSALPTSIAHKLKIIFV